MHAPPVPSEGETTVRVEEWVEKCDRLAKYGAQYALSEIFKTVALQQMLIGETRRAFDRWRMDGLTSEQLLVKVKESARSQRLDGEASKGKPAIDINRMEGWGPQEVAAEKAEEKGDTE